MASCSVEFCTFSLPISDSSFALAAPVSASSRALAMPVSVSSFALVTPDWAKTTALSFRLSKSILILNSSCSEYVGRRPAALPGTA